MAISDRLKEKREQLGISRAEASRRVGTTANCYGQWESGSVIPSAQSLIKIAQIFKVPIGWILGENRDTMGNPTEVNTVGADQKSDSKHLYKAPNGKLLCNVKQCEWRICGICPGAGCMKERAKR